MQKLSESPFDTVTIIGDFENGSPEWHELRNRPGVVGGSDVGVILGLSPWKSPLSLYHEALGAVSDTVEQSMPMKIGTALEPVLLSLFESEHPALEVFTIGTLGHVEHDWAHCNVDGLFRNSVGEWGILELKFSSQHWDGEPPANYRAQVMWYLHLTGLKSAKIAGLVGSRWVEYDIEYDEFEALALWDQVTKFRDMVLTQTPPDFDGSESTYQTMRELYPMGAEAEEELGELGIHLCNAYDRLNEAKAHWTEMQSRTLAALDTKKHGVVDGVRVCSKQQKGAGLPYLAMKGRK
jgi:putative phage-type endonuclease